jgi:serine/threonine-protein kinase HipA
MRKAKIYFQGIEAGILYEIIPEKKYIFEYINGYNGLPISLTMPLKTVKFEYNEFPSFFDGLLPEGNQLDGLLKYKKIDKNDLFSQLIAVGVDMVGAVTAKEIIE